jgi:hypothetical protein
MQVGARDVFVGDNSRPGQNSRVIRDPCGGGPDGGTPAILLGYYMLLRWVPVPGYGMPGVHVAFLDPRAIWRHGSTGRSFRRAIFISRVSTTRRVC